MATAPASATTSSECLTSDAIRPKLIIEFRSVEDALDRVEQLRTAGWFPAAAELHCADNLDLPSGVCAPSVVRSSKRIHAWLPLPDDDLDHELYFAPKDNPAGEPAALHRCPLSTVAAIHALEYSSGPLRCDPGRRYPRR